MTGSDRTESLSNTVDDATRDSVFAVRGVTVRRAGRTLVDDVSFDVRAGEVLAGMGPNGAGKSTLLAAMAGDFRPTRGSIALNGRDLGAWSAGDQARSRAVLTQTAGLTLPLTAFDIALLGRLPHHGGHPGAGDRALARDALARAGALALAARAYPTLSGGEQARVMLARAFAQVLRYGATTVEEPDAHERPRALLLDEPLAAFDVARQHAAFAAIRAVATDARCAVVAVLHDANLAMRHADRVALLRDGRLTAIGPVDTTLTERALGDCFSIRVRRLADPDGGAPLLLATG